MRPKSNLRSKHDRSFSLEMGHDLLNSANNSFLTNQNAIMINGQFVNNSSSLMNASKLIPTTKTLFDDSSTLLGSAQNSPHNNSNVMAPQQLLQYKKLNNHLQKNNRSPFVSSQQSSGFKPPMSGRQALSSSVSQSNIRTQSRRAERPSVNQFLENTDNSHDESKSIIRAIKVAVDFKFYKEKELIDTKRNIEINIEREQDAIEELRYKIKKHKDSLSHKQNAIVLRIQEIERILQNTNRSVSLDDRTKRFGNSEGFKMALNGINVLSTQSTGVSPISGNVTGVNLSSYEKEKAFSISDLNANSYSSNPYNNTVNCNGIEAGGNINSEGFFSLFDNYNLEAERKELMKNLHKVNHNLSHDLKLLETLMLRDPQHTTINLNDFKSIVRTSEESLHTLGNEKNLLLHKIYELEDKFNQYREIKNMIREDYYSHVELITECVVIHEELENHIEFMKLKYSDCYDDIMKDIEITEGLAKLDVEIRTEEGTHNQLSIQMNELSKELNILEEKFVNDSRELENLKEMENIIRQEILSPEKSIYFKIKENSIVVQQLLINPNQPLNNLFTFLKVFAISNEINSVELNKNINQIIEFQSKLVKDIIEIIQLRHDYDNIEKTFMQLQSKLSISTLQIDLENTIASNNSSNNNSLIQGISTTKSNESFISNMSSITLPTSRDNKKFLNTLQKEMINKKLQLVELSKKQETTTKNFFNSIDRSSSNQVFYQIIKENTQLNLLDILKTLQNFKIENMLLSLLNARRELYDSSLNITTELAQKCEDFQFINKQFTSLQSQYNEKSQEITVIVQSLDFKTQRTIELRSIQEEIQKNYKSALVKESEKIYQNYLQDHNKYLRKIKFQFGKTYITKLQKNILSDLDDANSTTIVKRKTEIYEIKRIISKMESIRASKTHKIENELKKNFHNTDQCLKESEAKLEFLNKDLLEVLEKGRKFNEELEKNLSTHKFNFGESKTINDSSRLLTPIASSASSINTQNGGNRYENLLSNIFATIQLYKTTISQSLCNIIDRVLVLKLKNSSSAEKLTVSQQVELQETIKKLQSELTNLNDIDYQSLDQYERDLKLCEETLKDKQIKLTTLRDDITNNKKISEAQDNALKDRTTILNEIQSHHSEVSTTLNSPAYDPHKFNIKSLSSSKSSAKLFKETPKYGTVTLDIKDNRSFHLNIDHITNKNAQDISHNLQLNDPSSTARSMLRTQSTANFTSSTSSVSQVILSAKSAGQNISDRSSIISGNISENNRGITSKTPSRGSFITNENKPPTANRFLILTDKIKLDDLSKEFEVGIPIYKKFSSSAAFGIKTDSIKTIEQVIKSYGKRIIKLNKSLKTIDIMKISLPLSRYSAEYSYEWRSIKKVFVPPKTMEIIKSYFSSINSNNIDKMALKDFKTDEQVILSFALDILNKGRIELISVNLKALLILYNVTNAIIEAGGNL